MTQERRRDGQEAPRQPRLGPHEARALFKAVSDHRIEAERVFGDVLVPAMPTWSDFARQYARYRRFASAPPIEPGSDSASDLWTFYALSRVFEWLTIGVQDRAGLGRHDPEWPREGDHPLLSRDELVRFFGALGMEPMRTRSRYHPFFHEVAAAVPDSALGDAILVDKEVWPGLRFGDLVFARAGVRVRCGPDAPFDPALAARSTLYFAWTRVYRPTCDLSHGWGSGSQWGTDLRRDYADGAVLRYNVDGCVRLTGDAIIPPPPPHDRSDDDADLCGDLTPAERVELLIHRCFVRTAKPHKDLWPFDDTYAEPAPGPNWTW